MPATANPPVRNRETYITTVGTAITFHMISGTDTANDKYLNLGIPANKWILRTDEDITIEKINGVDVLQDPITITADGAWSGSSKNNGMKLTSVTVRTGIVNTTVRLYVEA